MTTTLDVHLEDAAATAAVLVADIRAAARRFGRLGAVVAVSGGIDSAVCLGLAARALGPARTVAIALPDKESDPVSARLGAEVAGLFGVEFVVRDITDALDALGCYADRLAVVRRLSPGFDPAAGDAFSVEFVPAKGEGARLQSFVLTVVRGGVTTRRRLGGRDFLTIMAATNQKQRLRMLSAYRVADERNLLVVGTSNRLEIDQGFFVKHGDGCGEVFPLRYLLKSQVYDLGAHLGVPESIRRRPPTTDTFSAPQSQEEYFYGTSVETGDALWLAYHDGVTEDRAATATGLTAEDVGKFFGLYSRRSHYAGYLTATIPPDSRDAR